MDVDTLIKRLQYIHNTHGNLEVVGGYMSDDIPLEKATVIDADGIDAEFNNSTPIGVFFE